MRNKILDFINLHEGEEQKEKVLETVKSSISFRGSNLWILACAIVIASIGLNVNSTAVIIGAMLISPLMGPIVGTGFALAIYDFDLLKKSVKNLLIATLVSLLVATIYFYISPFKETQSELLARTSPNFYDVLIAFFGGLVGVIVLTRVEKGNPIPGVAIATALMPPLCTAGYGLAIGNLAYFMGAFYLYSINCVFICIATFIIVKYLKYKPVNNLNERFRKQLRYGILSLLFIMVIPSFYLAYNLFQERKFYQRVEQFITNEFSNNGYAIIYKDIKYTTTPKKIELAFLTVEFSQKQVDDFNKKLKYYEILNTEFKIRHNSKIINAENLRKHLLENKNLLHNNNITDTFSNHSIAKKNHMIAQKITPCLWVETKDAKGVADYYLSIFKNAKLKEHRTYNNPVEAGGGNFETAIVEVAGIELSILAAGPYFKFNESVSFVINCKDQTEVDYYWDALTSNGGEEGSCGWCKDKYGLSWQVVPVEYFELINNEDPKIREKALKNTFKQKKLILSELK